MVLFSSPLQPPSVSLTKLMVYTCIYYLSGHVCLGLVISFIKSFYYCFIFLLAVCCIWGYCFRKHPNRVNVEETSGINHTSHMFTPSSSSSDENYTVSTRFGAQTAPIRVLSHDGAVILLPRDAAAGGGERSFLYHYGNEMTGLREGVHYNTRYK